MRIRIKNGSNLQQALSELVKYLEDQRQMLCEKDMDIYFQIAGELPENETVLAVSNNGVEDISGTRFEEKKAALLRDWRYFVHTNIKEIQEIKSEISKCKKYLENAEKNNRSEENVKNRKVLLDGYQSSLKRKHWVKNSYEKFSKEIEENNVEYVFHDWQQYIIGSLDGEIYYFHTYYYKGKKVRYIKKGYPDRLPVEDLSRLKEKFAIREGK